MSPNPGLAGQPHFLYRLFDSTGALLYVGLTTSIEYRLGQHRRDKAWWPAVASHRVEEFAGKDAGLAAERAAIRHEQPMHNVKLNHSEDELRERIRQARAADRPRTYRHIARALSLSRAEVLRLAGVPLDSAAARWRGTSETALEPTDDEYRTARRR